MEIGRLRTFSRRIEQMDKQTRRARCGDVRKKGTSYLTTEKVSWSYTGTATVWTAKLDRTSCANNPPDWRIRRTIKEPDEQKDNPMYLINKLKFRGTWKYENCLQIDDSATADMHGTEESQQYCASKVTYLIRPVDRPMSDSKYSNPWYYNNKSYSDQ